MDNIDIRIAEGIEILKLIGMPTAQQNDRSSLALLALLNLSPEQNWAEGSSPMIGVTPIMEWVNTKYERPYAPNSRETFRRFTLHQFCEGGVAIYNPDKPDRAPNSPKACYQITPEFLLLAQSYGTKNFKAKLSLFLKNKKTLAQQYAMKREMSKIPLIIEGKEFLLTPGDHSILIEKIVNVFAPQFIQGSDLLYVGDTENKTGYFKSKTFEDLGIFINKKGKLPDVVFYHKKNNWLILVESVTSHGPVDGKRYKELNSLFKDSSAGLVFVTAFLNRKAMGKYIADISWESEVWIADNPTHMIHFNGDKFLGPYKHNDK